MRKYAEQVPSGSPADLARALSDADTFNRNVELAKKYFESLRKQNPMLAGSSLDYVRSKCDHLAGHHSAVLQDLAPRQRL